MKKLVLLACVGILLAGCASTEAEQAPREDPPVSVPPESAPEPTLDPPTEPELGLPEGYPQVVAISELPEHMQWAFEKTGTGQAVAVAPGVWAELAPGATAEDAVRAGVFSGFCSSLEAFERDYRNGDSTPGMCW